MCSKHFCLNHTVFSAHPIYKKQREPLEYEGGNYHEKVHGTLATVKRGFFTNWSLLNYARTYRL